MSGFQIPGLGQARPNETLLPLPPDTLVAAAVTSEPNDQTHETSRQAESEAGDGPEQDKPGDGDDAPQHNAAAEDPMAVDQPDNPPSLTHALEAAIGGLGEAGATQPQQARGGELHDDQGDKPEWEVDSSPYQLSSEPSSSDSSDDSDNEDYELFGVEETARLLMEAESRSGAKAAASAQVRTKNEMADEVMPKPDVAITPDMKIEELGSVEHMVEGVMLIKATTPGEYQVLDTGSVLCTADRVIIGAVAETMGKVLQPMHTVRFGSHDMAELGLGVGAKVFYPVDHAAYVFTQPLKNVRGSDASNIHDEEVGHDEIDFSDDEKEAEHRRSLKYKNKNGPRGPAAGPRGSHPLRNQVAPDAALNYDDGPYKPLARPPGYGTSGGPPAEPLEPPPRASVHRGGRRGDRRGRGGRGRDTGRGSRRASHGPPRDGHAFPPQQQQQPYAGGSWAPASSAAPPPPQPAPSLPTFGFQQPSWPQPQFPAPQAHGAPASALPLPPPPPPPGWPAHAAPAQQPAQQPSSGAFVNPALIAALVSQMQVQRGQQQ